MVSGRSSLPVTAPTSVVSRLLILSQVRAARLVFGVGRLDDEPFITRRPVVDHPPALGSVGVQECRCSVHSSPSHQRNPEVRSTSRYHPAGARSVGAADGAGEAVGWVGAAFIGSVELADE
jgi:hypothetical protein